MVTVIIRLQGQISKRKVVLGNEFDFIDSSGSPALILD